MKVDHRPWVLSAEFLKAIEEKNVKVVNAILDSGFDMDVNLMFCKNAISLCVSNGWYEMAQLLIQRGCSLSLKNEMSQQPLTVAVLRSDYRLVKLLLDNRADKTCLDLEGKSALHYACELNNLRIVELLTENASPSLLNLKSHNHRTPLSYASEYGGASLINQLLSKGANPNVIDYFWRTSLFCAMRNIQCTPEMVESLLDAGADVHHVNQTSETVLLYALRRFSMKIPKAQYKCDTRFQKICVLLIDRGCDVTAQNFLGETALHLAVQLEDAILVRKLINAGCPLDTENQLNLAPLFYACQVGAPYIVWLLLAGGADKDHIHDNSPAKWTWYQQGQHLKGDTDYAQVLRILRQTKGLGTLGESCRRVIRDALCPEYEKRALQLRLPTSIINFILLAN